MKLRTKRGDYKPGSYARRNLAHTLAATISGDPGWKPSCPNALVNQSDDDSYWQLDGGNNWFLNFDDSNPDHSVFSVRYRYQCRANPKEEALLGWLRTRLMNLEVVEWPYSGSHCDKPNRTAEDRYAEVLADTLLGMVAFQAAGELHRPISFLFASGATDPFDAMYLCGIPVLIAPPTVQVWVPGDGTCPLLPLWRGKRTEFQEKMTREFQLRYCKTGDF